MSTISTTHLRDRTHLLRRTGGVFILILAFVAGIGLGGIALILVAAITPSVPLFLSAGLLVMALVTFAIAWLAFRVFGLRRPRIGASLSALGVSLVVVVLAMSTVLQAFPLQASYPVPADVHFWTLADGSHISYRFQPAVGTRRETPVIFLHGGPGTPGEGLPFGTEQLVSAGLDVYAYDQIGSGRSDRLKNIRDYTVARNVADLEEIREMIGADKIILIGQSWGGSLAAQYLAAHPDHVAKAIFTSPGEIWPEAFAEGGEVSPWDQLEGEQRARYEELTGDPRLLMQAILMDVNPDAAHAFVSDAEADSRMHEIAVSGKESGLCPGTGATNDDVHHNLQGFYANQMTVRDFEKIADPRPVLRSVEVPALIMRGECDFVPWEDTREYRDTLPNSTLVYLSGAGHDLSAQRPDAYLESILAFVLDESLPLPAYTSDGNPATVSGRGRGQDRETETSPVS